MPRGKVDHQAAKSLRELRLERGWSSRETARQLGLNHSLVSRAVAGKPITQTNADLIGQRLELLNPDKPKSVTVSFATDLLHLLQSALKAYASSGGTRKPKVP